jgi:hypothetical protein
MADGQVVFEIKGDSSSINQTVKQVTNNIQDESKKWDDAAKQSTGGIESSFSGMLSKIAAAFSAAKIGQYILDFGKQALETASDLAEVQNVVDTVFGDSAGTIEAWAKRAGQQFGLTELQAKKFTSTLGAMMKSSGLAGTEIVNMSTDLAGLAADMASFYNLDFETAFEKIRSGISGETMPLKQLGINMSVANLEAFALAQGLEKTFSQMDQGEQTMLRYQYLMQATADAQGDFEKTSDGFANAQRRIQTALDTISSKAGKFILDTMEPLTGSIATFLENIASKGEGQRTVLDDFNDIEVDTSQKMADLEATYQKAESIIKLLEDISKQTVTLSDGSTKTFEELFADIGNIEENGGDVRGYIESLGLNVDDVIQKYNVWKEATRQLTNTVPELSAVIDQETGAIDGGTEALQKNLDQWRANEEKKIAWAAYYAKERALAEKKGEMYLYEFDAGAARTAVNRSMEQLQKVADENKLEIRYDEDGSVITFSKSWQSELTAGQRAFNAAAKEYNNAIEVSAKKTAEYEAQTVDLSEAEQQLADGKAALIEKYGEEEKAAEDAGEAAQTFGNKTSEAWNDSIKAAAEATKALNDYVEKVRETTAQTVNSVIKGFDKINKAGDGLRDKSSELAGQEAETLNKYSAVFGKWGSDNASLKNMAANWDSLTDTEKEAYEALVKIRNAQKETNDALNQYKPEGMKQSLQSQIDYMEEYIKNLDQLKEWGVSDELLASLSDGSTESAEYLKGLVEGGQEAAKEVGGMYDQLAEKKQGFTDALTQQKLTVDQTYQAMLDKAAETIAELNMGDEASTAMAGTVEGIANGIALKVPEVKSAVDALIAELNRLSGYGFSFEFDGEGGLSFPDIPSFAVGLDHVPFDGFLASLHEGEGILTAEENRIWQRFKNGQASSGNVDYDALGATMRDNVHAGGNVYLDGRTVGQVVSGIQGNNYRSLKRSGWQG